jgi:hypothetical protein
VLLAACFKSLLRCWNQHPHIQRHSIGFQMVLSLLSCKHLQLHIVNDNKTHQLGIIPICTSQQTLNKYTHHEIAPYRGLLLFPVFDWPRLIGSKIVGDKQICSQLLQQEHIEKIHIEGLWLGFTSPSHP